MNIRYNIILGISISLLIGCGQKTTDQKKETATVPVYIQKVAPNNTSSLITATGKIQASHNAELSTRFMGYITRIPVKVGDNVHKGQLLVAINNTELEAKKAQIQAQITTAKVAFDNAQKDYKRYQNLYQKKSVTAKEFEDITTHFHTAKTQWETARQQQKEIEAQLQYTNIKAPFSGVITQKFVNEGAIAHPGKPLLAIENSNRLEVHALVPETEIINIKQGTSVTINISAIAATFSGTVTAISTSSKHTGGQFLVKVALTSTHPKILSGMYATVLFPTTTIQNMSSTRVMLPKKALVRHGQLVGVYTPSQQNTAILRWLRLGKTFKDQVEVLSGLSANESYILSARGKLYNGVKIAIQ